MSAIDKLTIPLMVGGFAVGAAAVGTASVKLWGSATEHGDSRGEAGAAVLGLGVSGIIAGKIGLATVSRLIPWEARGALQGVSLLGGAVAVGAITAGTFAAVFGAATAASHISGKALS